MPEKGGGLEESRVQEWIAMAPSLPEFIVKIPALTNAPVIKALTYGHENVAF